VLNIRKRVIDVLPAEIYGPDELRCGGIQLSNNVFRKNVGCRNTQGAVSIVCMDDNNAKAIELNGKVEYQQVTDSQFFVGDTFAQSLLNPELQPDNYEDIHNDYDYSVYTPYFKHPDDSQTAPESMIKVNNYKLMLVNNTYD